MWYHLGQIFGVWIPGQWNFGTRVYDIELRWHYSHSINTLLFVQAFWPPLRHWGLQLLTLLSQTLSCLIIFSDLTFWTSDSSLIFAVREQCLEETTPCWIYWHLKISVSSSCMPYNWLINNMSLTSSKRMEVRNTIKSSTEVISQLKLYCILTLSVDYWFAHCDFTPCGCHCYYAVYKKARA